LSLLQLNSDYGNLSGMKTVEIHVPDDIMVRLEHLLATQGTDYVSVNTNEVVGREALLADLLVLGLDALDVGEAEFPDDIDE
jgi:hypothetical protein